MFAASIVRLIAFLLCVFFLSGILRSFKENFHPGVFQLLARQKCLGKYAGMLTTRTS